MTPDEANRLVTELTEPRRVLAQLTAAEADQLWRVFRDRQVAEQQRLLESVDHALGFLPRLARIPARKILFGR